MILLRTILAVAFVLAGSSRGRADDTAKCGNWRVTPPAELVDVCTAAITSNPKVAWAYHSRGLGYHGLKRYDAAIADFDKAIELLPDYAEAYNSRGISRSATGNLAASTSDFDVALRIRPKYPNALNNRAANAFLANDLPAAIADYTTVLALEPTHALAWTNRGLAHAKLGNAERALEDLNVAIEIDGKIIAAYKFRAQVLEYKGDKAGAFADYRRVLSLSPTDPLALREVKRLGGD